MLPGPVAAADTQAVGEDTQAAAAEEGIPVVVVRILAAAVARRTSTRHVLRLPTLRRRISALHVGISLHRIFRGPRSMRMRRRATSTVLVSVTPISATLM
ncbi:MAG: hypothetical protein WBD90_15850 [Xanthobacteraceae bacterium]